jgi:MFS family permease
LSVRSRHERGLRRKERTALALLALPTFGLALTITLVSSYLGEVTRRYTHETIVIGAIVGSEGAMALWVPLLAGSWSDRTTSRIGGRLPFVLAGALPAGAALIALGLVSSLGGVAAVTAVFFGFYFVAYEPYRAMYPDLLERDEVAGRAQSTQALARGLGTGAALLAGGLLLSVSRALPFVLFAVVLIAAVGAFTWLIFHRGLATRGEGAEECASRRRGDPARHVARRLAGVIGRQPELRAYLVANALWEMSLAALKSFVILYLTIGLRYSLRTSALIIGGVALVILVGAGAAGKLGDRYGRVRVLSIALCLYGAGYLVPTFTTARVALGVSIPMIAVGGGAVMTLAYAVLMPLMPEGEHGLLTGYYSLSRGLGIVSGPILAGVAIHFGAPSLWPGTHGFQAMWAVCAAGAILSLPFLRRLSRGAAAHRPPELQHR